MSYTSEVFAAVSGTKAALEALIQALKPFDTHEEQEFFSRFKLVRMEEDCWIYAFHDTNIQWYEKPENVWKVISQHARNFKFSYVFYRIGDDYEDVEVDEHCAENAANFYHILIELATFSRNIDLDDRLRSAFYN